MSYEVGDANNSCASGLQPLGSRDLRASASTGSTDHVAEHVGTAERGADFIETYQAEMPSELLLIPQSTFDTLLRPAAYQHLQRRFAVLKRYFTCK